MWKGIKIKVMTPKEKAKELVDGYYNQNFEDFGAYCSETAKKLALILVKNILDIETLIDWDFWADVKTEIEKL